MLIINSHLEHKKNILYVVDMIIKPTIEYGNKICCIITQVNIEFPEH
jgi:hypothetical protein